MDLDPSSLFASLLVSSAGFVLFSYGRRQRRFPHLAIGLAMCAYPYLMSDFAPMLGIAALLLAALWLLTRFGF